MNRHEPTMNSQSLQVVKKLFHGLTVVLGALVLTVLFFLVLPLIQTINQPPQDDMVVRTVDTAQMPPPPPPPEEEPPEQEPEEEPPELEEQTEPLDLSQLELALNPGFDEGWATGDFNVKLNAAGAGDDNVDALFSMSELDQKPRPIYQPSPAYPPNARRHAPGTVYVIFIVNRNGRVEQAKVQKSSHPVFEKPALDAIKRWKFEPGQRNGKPVRFRMRLPMTFPKR